MRLFYSTFFLLFFSFIGKSQKLLKGIVIDEQNNKPIANASVFLNTTSLGTVTNGQGNFELVLPSGRYELIVSSIGYSTYNQTVYTDKVQDFLIIKLKLKTLVMETVIIEPYEKDGWEKWGNFFLNCGNE